MYNYFTDDQSEPKAIQIKTTVRNQDRLRGAALNVGMTQGNVLSVCLSLIDLCGVVHGPDRRAPDLLLLAVESCAGLGLLSNAEKQTILAGAMNLTMEESFRLLWGVISAKPELQAVRRQRLDEQYAALMVDADEPFTPVDDDAEAKMAAWLREQEAKAAE